MWTITHEDAPVDIVSVGDMIVLFSYASFCDCVNIAVVACGVLFTLSLNIF